MKNWWMAGRCSCIRTRKSGCELDTNRYYVGGGTAAISLKPTHQTHIQSDKMHTQPYMPPPLPPSAYPGNPFPSSSLSGKSMNTEGHLWRQVRISLSKPHNAIKPTTNQSTHGWLACAHTPLISVDLALSHSPAADPPLPVSLHFLVYLRYPIQIQLMLYR